MMARKKVPLGIRKFDSIMNASMIELIVGVLMSLIDTGVTGQSLA